ncbi:5-formyltetrahydrofolate cyclo-ligase [Polymorphum gilvum]|uniref:Putative 5-formyltetrahydrofolate cyclo-ligase n=1 Tax=Polymorphum gilvum (strain LMG 25793 / CGMCC 1.9160 / SL003B-26A1) TaxID=991905 RepID=F2IWR1_POLGS|nr:5-formyltetrahydrofolate cyclo-ligase [Polymorphum gilvum]ADZ70386.1 Putative 5-formyltetrahydrofolate cyclo-ligase [Polymorphum gilvum SL003B-26A1]
MTHARWAGRNTDKDVVRDEVWTALVDNEVNVGPVNSRIPNFAGADVAALNLSRLAQWQEARVVKCNPDPPQIPVRLRALYDGKIVYAPVPELVKGFPFVRLDPDKLDSKGVQFELAATSQGYLEYGDPCEFEDMEPLDFIVVGCVAVTRNGGRTGKGGGFADLELGIFRELGKVKADAPITTTVHSTQVVDNDRVIMLDHDSALHFIATEKELIDTATPYPQPTGVAWDFVQEDQYRDIPFLETLRSRITGA